MTSASWADHKTPEPADPDSADTDMGTDTGTDTDRWDRLGWAIEAHERFLDELAPAIRVRLSRVGPQAGVALYGPTQVGKTTLILTLLKVRPDRLDEVSDVLRAGREAGQSSTTAATRYRSSGHDAWSWHAGEDDVRRLGADDVRRRLVEVRERAVRGAWPLDRVVEIGLPADCFPESGAAPLRILDLPGVKAADYDEDQTARRLLETWIAVCDPVLLVTRVGSPGYLAPGQMAVEALRLWTRQLHKFRVVVTHAFTDGTTQEWLADESVPEHSRQALTDDILTDYSRREKDIQWPTTDAGWLYPLDVGDSRAALENAGSPVALAMCEESLDALRTAIADAMRPETRIRGAFEAWNVARDVQREREQEFAESAEALRNRITDAEKELHRARHSAQEREAERAATAEFLPLVKTHKPAELPAVAAVPSMTDAAVNLRRAFDDGWDEWSHALHLVVQNRPEHIGDALRIPTDDMTRHAAADQVLRSLVAPNSGGSRRIWPLRRRSRDSAGLVAATHQRLAELLTATCTDRIRQLTEAVEEESKKAERAHQRAVQRAGRAAVALHDAQERLAQHATDVDRERGNIAEHVRIAAEFPNRLAEAYERERRRLVDLVSAAGDPARALVASAAVLDCTWLYETIRDGA